MSKIAFSIWQGWIRRSHESPSDKSYFSDKKDDLLKHLASPLKIHSTPVPLSEENLQVIKNDDLQGMRKESKLMYNRYASSLESLEGKTIQVTTLSIDIVNSSEKVKTLSSEAAGEYYQTFIESISDLIQHYGGYVLKNVGDCVIAFFPCRKYKIENHDTAVLCGLAMREMVKHILGPYFMKRNLPSVACRISADFGEARVLRIRSNGDYSTVDLFGIAMNSVSKILHYAKPNQMVIGENLFWELIDMEYFDFTLVRRFDLTGKYPYPVYLVEPKKGVFAK